VLEDCVMHRILITGRNRSVPRDAFAATALPEVYITRLVMADAELEIPCAAYLRRTTFRRDAGVRAGRHPAHPCMSTHRSSAPGVQPKPPAWRGALPCVAMMLAASCAVVGVLTVALL
jgi:hypothetical protein